MHVDNRSILRPVLAVAVCAFATVAFLGTVRAAQWQGSIETDGSITRINNPATPVNEPEILHPQEMWRLDGSADDAFFGIIYRAVADSAGQVYLLDNQQKQVLVVNPYGDICLSIGREGNGPGEFVRVVDVFVDSEGRVGVVQNAPGKIEMFDTSGHPMGRLFLPEYGNKSLLKVRSAKFAAGRVYASLLNRVRTGNQDREAYNALVSLAGEGQEHIQYEEIVFCRAFNDWHYREQGRERGVSPWVWTVGPGGRVYSNRAFASYEISVYDSDGELEHVIHREYVSRQRPDSDVEDLQAYYDNRNEGRFFGGSPLTYAVSRTDPDIEKIFAREDGALWALSSRGAYDKPEGVLGIFDVFDCDGLFDHQAIVHGEGDFNTDYFFISNGLLVVVRNITVDLSDGQDGASTANRKYEVICYRL